MKKISIILLLSLSVLSCKYKNSSEMEEKASASKLKDTTMVGADQDENGCLASAGYTWSKVNKECVKIFTGIQLNPAQNQTNEDMVLCAYVLFNENGNEAEVFLPNEESIVLSRPEEGKPWSNANYQLTAKNGYTLKKATEIIYIGDGTMGNKVTGSDQQEE
jgi:hypothetical protein